MPFIPSSFRPFSILKNRHVQTILHSTLRRVTVNYSRERYNTPDNDFFDVDWIKSSSSTLIIIIHGLESSSRRNYVKGMANALSKDHFDVACLNLRGCSGQANNLVKSYHSGFYLDLNQLHQEASNQYKNIHFIGFSLGGSILLNFLASQPTLPTTSKAVAISTPLDLAACAEKLDEPSNKLYRRRFINKLKAKALIKTALPSCPYTKAEIDACKSFFDFDNIYTARVNGYENARTYYEANSSLPKLKNIQIPTLIINALDDPFLSTSCFPKQLAKNSNLISLLTPSQGGHVGFYDCSPFQKIYWHEKQSVDFLSA